MPMIGLYRIHQEQIKKVEQSLKAPFQIHKGDTGTGNPQVKKPEHMRQKSLSVKGSLAAMYPVTNGCAWIPRHHPHLRYPHSGASAATPACLNWIFSIPISPAYASAAGKNRRRAYEHEKEKSKEIIITDTRI